MITFHIKWHPHYCWPYPFLGFFLTDASRMLSKKKEKEKENGRTASPHADALSATRFISRIRIAILRRAIPHRSELLPHPSTILIPNPKPRLDQAPSLQISFPHSSPLVPLSLDAFMSHGGGRCPRPARCIRRRHCWTQRRLETAATTCPSGAL